MSKLEMFFMGLSIFSSGVAAILFRNMLKLAKMIASMTKTEKDDALVEWAFNFDNEMRNAVTDLQVKHDKNRLKIQDIKDNG